MANKSLRSLSKDRMVKQHRPTWWKRRFSGVDNWNVPFLAAIQCLQLGRSWQCSWFSKLEGWQIDSLKEIQTIIIFSHFPHYFRWYHHLQKIGYQIQHFMGSSEDLSLAAWGEYQDIPSAQRASNRWEGGFSAVLQELLDSMSYFSVSWFNMFSCWSRDRSNFPKGFFWWITLRNHPRFWFLFVWSESLPKDKMLQEALKDLFRLGDERCGGLLAPNSALEERGFK